MSICKEQLTHIFTKVIQFINTKYEGRIRNISPELPSVEISAEYSVYFNSYLITGTSSKSTRSLFYVHLNPDTLYTSASEKFKRKSRTFQSNNRNLTLMTYHNKMINISALEGEKYIYNQDYEVDFSTAMFELRTLGCNACTALVIESMSELLYNGSLTKYDDITFIFNVDYIQEFIELQGIQCTE